MADRASGEWQLFNLRLPLHAMERIHRYRDHLNATQPGIEANVSMAARMLLMRALDEVEEEMGIQRKPKTNPQDQGRVRKKG
jgi:hypothetical protein